MTNSVIRTALLAALVLMPLSSGYALAQNSPGALGTLLQNRNKNYGSNVITVSNLTTSKRIAVAAQPPLTQEQYNQIMSESLAQNQAILNQRLESVKSAYAKQKAAFDKEDSARLQAPTEPVVSQAAIAMPGAAQPQAAIQPVTTDSPAKTKVFIPKKQDSNQPVRLFNTRERTTTE